MTPFQQAVLEAADAALSVYREQHTEIVCMIRCRDIEVSVTLAPLELPSPVRLLRGPGATV